MLWRRALRCIIKVFCPFSRGKEVGTIAYVCHGNMRCMTWNDLRSRLLQSSLSEFILWFQCWSTSQRKASRLFPQVFANPSAHEKPHGEMFFLHNSCESGETTCLDCFGSVSIPFSYLFNFYPPARLSVEVLSWIVRKQIIQQVSFKVV